MRTQSLALMDSQNFLMRDILDATAEGIWGLDLHGNITFVNAAAVKLLGFTSAEEMIGRNGHELVHYQRPDGTPYPKIDCPIFDAFRKEISVHLESEVLWRKDGSSFPVAPDLSRRTSGRGRC